MNRHTRYGLVALGVLISAVSFNPVYAQETNSSEASNQNDDSDDVALESATGANVAGASRLEITVTNLTRGQQFTPILVATHKRGVRIFQAGQPASPQLATLAEEGNTGPLAGLLSGNPEVGDVVTSSGGLTNPGQSTTIVVERRGRFRNVTVAAMLIPTNDTFFSVMDATSPRGRQEIVLFAPAYDAGSERNDELCASIPGPQFSECGGPGGGAKVGQGEGFVHISSGIHGIGSFKPNNRDWRNPVARIVIKRMNE
jgi:hypothetical protein